MAKGFSVSGPPETEERRTNHSTDYLSKTAGAVVFKAIVKGLSVKPPAETEFLDRFPAFAGAA